MSNKIYSDHDRHLIKSGEIVVEFRNEEEQGRFARFHSLERARKFAKQKKQEGYTVHAFECIADDLTNDITWKL